MSAPSMDAVGFTARWVAAARARESERCDALFVDPCAHALAGHEAFAHLDMLNALSEPQGAMPPSNPYLPVRTRYFDDYLRYAARDCAQIVVLAAGMDARAWRIDWPNDLQLFEIDRPAVFAYKEPILRALGLRARCARHVVGADLAEDWRPLLMARGFDPSVPTTWLAEGLFVYLFEHQVKGILADLTALSAPSSRLAVDLADVSLLAWPPMLPYFERLKTDGSPWTFGTAEPESLLEEAGWRARALVVGEPGTTYDRWPFPPAPRQVPGVPRSYFVTSIRPAECGSAAAPQDSAKLGAVVGRFVASHRVRPPFSMGSGVEYNVVDPRRCATIGAAGIICLMRRNILRGLRATLGPLRDRRGST